MSNAVRHSRPSLTEIVEELMQGESQNRFARRIGVNQSDLSRFLAGKRGPGQIAIALLREFPASRDDIVNALTAGANERPAAVA